MAAVSDPSNHKPRPLWLIIGIAAAAAVVAVVATALLINIFEHKQEARNPFYRVVELDDDTEEPAQWGKNFPLQYDDYLRTVDQVRTRFGGSEALPRTPFRNGSALGCRALQAGRRSALEKNVGRLCLRTRLSGRARPCLHARRSNLHGTADRG